MSSTASGDFDTKYGIVHCRYPGPKNDPPYDNVRTYVRDVGNVTLQGPALRAFKAAEWRATPLRMKRKGKTLPILITGVGYRSYTLQKYYYDSVKGTEDEGRYANPDTSMHCEALAVDIDMTQGVLRRARIKKALIAEGWHYAVDGEPWHASYRIPG